MNEDELDEDDNPELQKAKLKMIQDEFADELKKKTEKLRPRLLGLIWQNNDGTQPSDCSNGIWNLLQARSFMFNGPCINLTPQTNDAADNSGDEGDGGGKNNSKRSLKISEKEVPELIRLINGNEFNIKFLIREFLAHIKNNTSSTRDFSIKSIRDKIRELASYTKCPEEGLMFKKTCWYVPIETRKRYDLGDLTFPNIWQYTLTPPRPIESLAAVEKEKQKLIEIEIEKEKLKERIKRDYRQYSDDDDDNDDVLCLSDSNSCGISESVTSESVKQASAKPSNFNIAKFIRVLTDEEKKKQFGSLTLRRPSSDQLDPLSTNSLPSSPLVTESNSVDGKNSNNKQLKMQAVVKKRVQLSASIPYGQESSPKLKNTLVTQFLNNQPRKRKASVDESSNIRTRPNDGAKKRFVSPDIVIIDE